MRKIQSFSFFSFLPDLQDRKISGDIIVLVSFRFYNLQPPQNAYVYGFSFFSFLH
ncbi:hypothetical protein YN1HA_18630 [Sulfurisphaera ohwakuensis]